MYHALHKRSIEHPESYWLEAAGKLDWFSAPKIALAKDELGSDRWFVDGQLNTCHLAVDTHVNNGRGDQIAIIYDSPVTQTKRQITYAQLQADVAQLAGAIAAQASAKAIASFCICQ